MDDETICYIFMYSFYLKVVHCHPLWYNRFIMSCIRCGEDAANMFCRRCQKTHNLCACGKVKMRKVELCPDCRPVKPPAAVCEKCGKQVNTRQIRWCKDCTERHIWTEVEDAFLRRFYPEHGAEWCATRLHTDAGKVRTRASELRIALTQEAYRRIVHNAASAANSGRKHSAEYAAGCRQRAMERLDFFKEQLLKGRLANQKNKPSGLERKLWGILDGLGVTFEKQVEIKRSFLVDVRIGSLIIEADGDWWHGHPRFEPLNERQAQQKARDASRDTYLRACGYTVERIWESDMSLETVSVILQKHQII